MFAVCAGYQLIGRQFGGVEGEPVAGLGILDISSGRGDRRGVGEIVADVDPELGVPRLTGFENHQGVTSIGPGARPLARVTLGVGNGDGTEGAYAGKVLGTYLHGPALARNPGLADLLLSWVAGPLPPLDTGREDWAGRCAPSGWPRRPSSRRLARPLVDERLRAVGQDLGHERRRARDPDAVDHVILGDRRAGPRTACTASRCPRRARSRAGRAAESRAAGPGPGSRPGSAIQDASPVSHSDTGTPLAAAAAATVNA